MQQKGGEKENARPATGSGRVGDSFGGKEYLARHLSGDPYKGL